MRPPNFFIVGAPKCGTTSLAAWLAAHPAVYMPPLKEPAHFASDLKGSRSLDEYDALFAAAGDGHAAVGEASTCYLFSQVAVPSILAHVAPPRFVVCLRNPIEMARSLHQQELSELNEDVPDFAEAWHRQEARRLGRHIPRTCQEPWLLRYEARCRLGEQVERLLRHTPRDRAIFVLLEDMGRDPRQQYQRVLRFLGLPDDGRVQFPALNKGKATRSRLVKEGVAYLASVKAALGIRRRLGMRPLLERWNTREAPRTEIADETKQLLSGAFAADILKLGGLLEQDLTRWLE